MINTSTAQVLRASYIFDTLGEGDVPAMIHLHKIVRGNLPPENRHFTIEKSEALLAQFTHGPHIAVGLFAESGMELAAMALVGFAQEVPDFASRRGLVQTVLVSPAHQGQGLMRRLLEHIESCAAHPEVETVLHSRVAEGNLPSERSFRNAGFTFAGRGVRDLDGTPLVLFEKIVAKGGRV